jgi:hypothetical protein
MPVISLFLHTPPGDVTRRFVADMLETLKNNNRLIINGWMNSKQPVPNTVWDLGLMYKPPTDAEANTPYQRFYNVLDMQDRNQFSCGDAAAYEAAVQEEKYGKAAEVSVVPQGPFQYHAIYISENGPVDPTENWLKKYARRQGREHRAHMGMNRW